MTYRHKLARRLAASRPLARRIVAYQAFGMHAFILLAAACAAGEPTATGDVSSSDAPIALAPRAVTLETNQASTFKAYAKATKGDSQVTAIEWVATGGNISVDGKYSSNAIGSFKVIGRRSTTMGTTADTAQVSVVPPQPSLTKVNVSPSAASLPGSGQQLFTVAGRLGDGSSVPIGVVWSATGGSIDAGGLYTAGSTPGTYRVVARNTLGTIADTVAVAVLQPIDHVVLTPGSASLQAGRTAQFSASGALADGTPVPVTNVTYTSTGGTITSSGLYTAGQTSGDYTVTAAISGGTSLQATATVTISGGSGGGAPPPSNQPTTDPGHVNEPGGFTRIAETDFRGGLPADGWDCSRTGIIAGCWYQYNNSLSSLKQDPTAPGSSTVFEYVWPAGLAVGTSAGQFGGWATSDRDNRVEYRKVYESGWFKIPSGDFEIPSGGMKLLGYWGVGQAPHAGQQVYTVINGGGVQSSFTLDIRQQNQVARAMAQNVNTGALIRCGQWIHYEILMTLNDIGAANGSLRVWLNGKLTHDYRDVRWRTSDSPSGFYERHWDPIWGGNGNVAKSRADRMWINHIFISGVR